MRNKVKLYKIGDEVALVFDGKVYREAEQLFLEDVESAPTPVPKSKKKVQEGETRRVITCGNCDKPGHQRRTCQKNANQVFERGGDGKGKDVKIDTGKFDEIKESQKAGVKSLEISNETGVSLEGVNKIFASTKFEYFKQ